MIVGGQGWVIDVKRNLFKDGELGFFHLFLQPEVACLRWEKSSGTPLEERVAFSRNPLDQGYFVFRKK